MKIKKEMLLKQDEFLIEIDNAPNEDVIFIFNRDRTGCGCEDDKMNSLLVHLSIRALARLPKSPAALVFYGTGVNLALKNGESGKSLLALQEKGTSIYYGSTSVEYLKLNMADLVGERIQPTQLMDRLMNAGKVITL